MRERKTRHKDTTDNLVGKKVIIDREEEDEKTMDKFEELHKGWAKVPESKQIQMDEAKKKECICPKCPTYTNCAKNAKELLFCMKGKSFMCIDKAVECICPNCPVTGEYGLKHKFFCMKGAEKAQRYENALWGTKIV